MDMSGMHPAAAGVDTAGLVLRLLLLSGAAVVAGLGLLRASVRGTGRATAVVAWSCAAVSAAASLLSIPLVDVSVPVAVVHAVLVLAVPVALRWSAPAGYLGFALTVLLVVESALGHEPAEFLATAAASAAIVVWLGFASLGFTVPAEQRPEAAGRLRTLALVLAALLAVAVVVHLVTSGIADRRLLSPFGADLLVLALSTVVAGGLAALLRDPWRIYRFGAAAVAVAFVALALLPAIPRPGELPQPGVARLAHTSLGGQDVPVLVTPHRPGPNLVHLPESAGSDITVDTGGTPVRAVPRPGATGTWAQVDLPAGRSDLVLRSGSDSADVDVDTGDRPGPVTAAGDDGPECAGAALAGLVAGQRAELTGCPADALQPADADALRSLVDYVRGSGAPGISLISDSSPRSRQAADTVRAAAARTGLPVSDAPRQENALLVVTGWQRAAEHLEHSDTTYDYGVHLAPWLLHSKVTAATASSTAPLRFDPRDQRALAYGMTLHGTFPGETPSVAGYEKWLAARGMRPDDPLSIYAAAQVDVMQMDMPGMPGERMPMHGSDPAGQWLPRGTVVPVTGALAP